MARKQLSKKVRFEVFKRDSFTCQYCGATPPEVVLHVDHIHPVAEGGTNDTDNLITSCDACNLGKGARLLSSVPSSLKDRASVEEEREAQIKAYNKVLTAKAKRIENECWDVAAALEGVEWVETYNTQNLQSIKTFLTKLPLAMVVEAAEIARTRKPYSNIQKFKYFCGVCWRMIAEQNNG